eukprot:gene13516-13635_t
MDPFVVAAFYQFAEIAEPGRARAALARLACGLRLKGTLIVAAEGVNGTLAGPAEQIDTLVAALRAGVDGVPPLSRLELKLDPAAAMPFRRLKVKLKPEIVTIADGSADPLRAVGTYVEPADWNALIDDPEIVVIDTRNDFEVAIGSFERAIDPGTAKFSEFPSWVDRTLDPSRDRKVAMFCTGGIRCEKATSLLLARGFGEVFHLKGGILNYLKTVPKEQSRWHGACFVFDEREVVE